MTGFIRILRENFSPLKIANFRRYFTGQAISLIGTWLQLTAQGWVVWELSHSEAALGVVAMLGTLPILLLGPWAGVWADRLNRRRLLIGTQCGAMILAFILAGLTQAGIVQLWHVYVLSGLLGVITAIDFPAQQAFIGDLSGIAEVRKAVNVNSMIVQISRMAGPALAGLVISALGAATAFWINGLSFLAVIVSLLVVRSSQARTQPTNASALGEFRDALGFIRTQPRLVDLIVFVMIVAFFGISVINIMPAVASEVLKGDARTLGYLLASAGAGALVGTVILVPYTQSLRKTGIVVGSAVFWMGIWYMILSISTWLPLSLLSIFASGLAAPVVFTMAIGLLQVMAPPGMRARLLSLFVMVSFGMQPLASLLVGASAQVLGTPLAILINGLFLLAGPLMMLATRPNLRRWELSLQPVKIPGD